MPEIDADLLELFAGPGGWSEGLRLAGSTGTAVGIDTCPVACGVATAAGHARIRGSAARTYRTTNRVRCVIASPPCQSYSQAGNGDGWRDQHAVRTLIDAYVSGREPVARQWVDARSPLTAEPVRWIMQIRPRWFALEQVVAVRPLWDHIAARLFDVGYQCAVGIVSAEQFGVAQTRRRAILLGSLDTTPALPAATHHAYRDVVQHLAAPVGMDNALGVMGRPEWDGVRMRSNYSAPGVYGATAAERGRTMRELSAPSLTITGRAPQWETPDGARRKLTVIESGVLQSFSASYPWTAPTSDGIVTTLVQQRQLVADAVPPVLAAAILAQFM